MKPLSSAMTVLNRTVAPVMFIIVAGVMIVRSGGHLGVLWIALPVWAYMIWSGWSLCDVWLDGDALQIRRYRKLFRVPLAHVAVLESNNFGRGGRVIVLGLDPPVGKVDKVRFIPEGSWVVFGPNPADALEQDLRARVHAARAARKA